ncbi:hypothetical protein LCGC14_1554130 [marine sediment metagenome]|uniref:Major tail protein n=1 Tax=marine sediment metagenome TaxID=412755 RepID=A0A0F9LQ70_9ZZZZ
MAGTYPQAWEEVAQVAILKLGGTVYGYGAITETIDISEPDYPGESIPTTAGGRVWKQSPQEDGEITLEIYPLEVDPTGSAGLFNEFAGGTASSSEPQETDTSWTAGVDRTRDRFLVAIMWTDDATLNTPALVLDHDSLSAANKVALRFYAKECRITSHKSDFTDGILKTTVTFKFPAMNAGGTAKTHQWGSTNDVAASPLDQLTYSSGL